ncbi:MAG TPA: hypothetical protein VFC18_08135 [Burkholderiales bacterium]|nr:hypothetical protein [Burkholderiales bacterium]
MPNDDVRLEQEKQRTEDLLQNASDAYIPLAVAAALAFHQAHGNTRAIVNRRDYDDALNIAAAALSRLIPLYTLRAPRQGRVPVAVNLVHQRFQRGATELHGDDGSVMRALSVRRSDLVSALSLVKRAGLGFAFAFPTTR